MGLIKDVRTDGLGGLSHNVITGAARGPRQLGPGALVVAGLVRARVLRDRDDGHGRRPLRHRPLRHGGLPRLAAPGRHHDRRRPRQPEDGTRAASGLRPDDGAQVGHLDGRVRVVRRDVQQLRDRAGRRPDRAGRRLRTRLPADARDAAARDRDAAPVDRGRRAPAPPRADYRRRRQHARPGDPRHRRCRCSSGASEHGRRDHARARRGRTGRRRRRAAARARLPGRRVARPARRPSRPRAVRRRRQGARRRRLRDVRRPHRRRLPRLHATRRCPTA